MSAPIYNYQFDCPYDFYVFIDSNDGNKIKARNMKTGAMDAAGTHATNADVPMQYAVDQLSVGSTLRTTTGAVPGVGDNYQLWTGGKYGKIFVGPGLFNFYKYVILKSNIMIDACGPFATVFTMPDNLYTVSHNNNTIGIFKSSYWDINSFGANGTSTTQLGLGDVGIILKNFEIYGNWRNNVIPPANTATTTGLGTAASPETAGTDSWGHGIALYGSRFMIENVLVHGMPGAGIILQVYPGAGVFGGSGYPYGVYYPVGTLNQGSGMYDDVNYVINCRSWGNGRQGLLIRAPTHVSKFWGYYNGEAAIDVQRCAYFIDGYATIEDIEVWGNGLKHDTSNGNFSTLPYDPLAFSMRLTSSYWMSNCWVEGPNAPGDVLMIGASLGALASPTGWQIGGGNVGGFMSNTIIDTVQFSGIYLGKSATGNAIRNLSVVNATSNNTASTPMTIIGGYNDVEIAFSGWNGTAPTNQGIVLGDASQISWGNNLKIRSVNNTYVLNNQNANQYFDIDATVLDLTAGTRYVLQPGSTPIDYTKTRIKTEVLGGTVNALKSHNGGIATFSGDGSNKVFNIPHLLFDIPSVTNANANSDDARGPPTVTFDATNIIVTYGIAPPTGTSNVKLLWNARVSP